MSPRRLFALFVVFLLGCSRSPQHDFEAGVAYFKAEKFAKAEACFARAVAGSSPTAQAFNFLGVSQLEESKTDAAIQSFQEALKLDPGHTAAQQNLAMAFIEQGKPESAIPLLRKIPSEQPELGLAYMRAGAWRQARDVLQKCGDAPEVLNALGVANARLGNYREAKENFEHCLSVSPDFASACLNLAIIEHRHLGQKNMALTHYQHYLDLLPKNEPRDDVRQVAAQLAQDLAPRPQPIETAAATPPPKPPEPAKPTPPVEQPAAPKPEPVPVVATAPSPPPPQPVVKRRTPIAAQTLKPGNTTKAQAYFNEGIGLQQQGKLAAAISSYSKAVATDPTLAKAYYNLAHTYADTRQADRALDNYELALLANPKYTDARINYAILLQKEGYIVDALTQYEQILKGAPDNALFQLTTGNLYARDRATYDKARQHFQAYLKLAPNDPPARGVRRWLEQNP